VVFGFIAAFFGLMAMTGSTRSPRICSPRSGADYKRWPHVLNQTMVPLNMHRFVGELLLRGLSHRRGEWRYLKSTRDDDRSTTTGWGTSGCCGVRVPDPATGDWVRLPQGIESSPEAFHTIMLGDGAWVFNLLATYLAIMSLAATAYRASS